MRAYYTYFKLKFISSLQYRQAAWAGIATQFFFGFVYIMVYIAFYDSGGNNIPMSINQVITYLWLNQSFLALINQFSKEQELFKLIKDGGISYELARPKDLYFMWYFKIIGGRLANVSLRFFPLIIVTSLLPYPYNLSLPNSLEHFILSLFSLSMGTFLIAALTVLYPIITLYTMNEKGIVNLIITLGDILSGVVVPIPFFPKFMQIISKYLPFQYISDLPFRLYVGNIDIIDGIYGIIIQIIWIFIIILLGHFIMKKNLDRVVVQGG